jgi:hypothetical protein
MEKFFVRSLGVQREDLDREMTKIKKASGKKGEV